MSVDLIRTPPPWSGASPAELAQAAGAEDLFVFRRVGARRYAHLGGSGRGVGWAGIVEVGTEEEPAVARMVADSSIVRVSGAEPTQVFGPYYTRAAVMVPIGEDAFVVFGSANGSLHDVSDGELLELGRTAAEAVEEVGPAKRLADELETLHAVQDLLHAPADTFADGLQRLADQAARSLSCDLGLVYVAGREPVIADLAGQRLFDPDGVATALAEIARLEAIPCCVQRAWAAELPAPFRSADGVLAYYLLRLTQPLPGVVALLHTTAAPPRGFTSLCQSLGRKLVEAAEPLLTSALMRDTMRAELERAEAEARRDPLTNLANRLAWAERLATASPTSESPVSVIQLDCRGLKEINETHGHHAGDELLRRVAAILRRCAGSEGLVARLGGDEFGILLYGTDEAGARSVVGSIESTLPAEGSWPEWSDVEIALAIGTATCRDGDLDAAQQQADAEMLAAKRLLRRTH